MTKFKNYLLTTAFLLALGSLQAAAAATYSLTLGNDTPGFADGSVPPLFPQILNAQSGQPAPFNGACGGDLSSNCSAGWTFNYAPIVEEILGASLTIGIVDHDSAAPGSQLSLLDLDGSNRTLELDALLESGGGQDGQYNEYTINLDAALLPSLADGSLAVLFALQGDGLQTCTLAFLCPGQTVPFVSPTAFNGANLI